MRVDRLSGRPLEDEFADEVDLPLDDRLKKFAELAREIRRIEPLERGAGRSDAVHGTADEVTDAAKAIRAALDHAAASFSREEAAELQRSARLSSEDLKLLEEHRNRARRRSKVRTRDRDRD